VLVDGVIAIVASIFGRGEARGLLALIGVLSAIAGLILIKKPFETLVVFTLIVGVWFVVAGIVRGVTVFASPEARGGNILIALLDLIAGAVILAWPDLGLATLAVIIGIVPLCEAACSSPPAGSFIGSTARRKRTRARAPWPKARSAAPKASPLTAARRAGAASPFPRGVLRAVTDGQRGASARPTTKES
jgi:hypothetical protein